MGRFTGHQLSAAPMTPRSSQPQLSVQQHLAPPADRKPARVERSVSPMMSPVAQHRGRLASPPPSGALGVRSAVIATGLLPIPVPLTAQPPQPPPPASARLAAARLVSAPVGWSAGAQPVEWNSHQSHRLELQDVGRAAGLGVRLLGPEGRGSVIGALEGLNNGGIRCPEGLCIAFSRSSQAYFLLWRAGREQAALARVV